MNDATPAAWTGQVRPAHLLRAAMLLTEVRTGELPAERAVEAFVRRHRDMGRRDRAVVTDMVYTCLRHARLLRAGLSGGEPDALLECAAGLVMVHGMAAADVPARELDAPTRERLHAAAGIDVSTLPFAVRHSLPDWLAAALLDQYGALEADQLAQELNAPATLDLRVNTLAATRDTVGEEFARAGKDFAPTPWSPDGLRHAGRLALQASEAFRAGRIEIQDEGSQLVSYLLEPAPGEHIIDLCAGGGGKTLHLGALMGDRGRIDACDVAPRRLEQLRLRSLRAGLGIVQAHTLDPASTPDLVPADAVLVDAPCSGTGTLRRHPQLKWRPFDLPGYSARQAALLDTAAALVRPGGRLVYCTCSLLPQENEAIVGAFLDRHTGFEVEPAGTILERAGIVVPDSHDSRGGLRLLPHRHRTDGFHAVRLRRGSGS